MSKKEHTHNAKLTSSSSLQLNVYFTDDFCISKLVQYGIN